MALRRLVLVLLMASAVHAQSNIGGGGGSTGTQAAPSGIAYAQQGYYNVKNYGAIGDAKSTNTATTTNGTATVTDATASPWLSTDCQSGGGCTGTVNKKIFCTGSGIGSLGASGTAAPTTIIGFTSSSSITVGANGNGGAGSGQRCVWGTQDDTAAFTAAYNAAKASLSSFDSALASPSLAYPGAVYIPPGGYIVSGPIMQQVNANNYSRGVNLIGAGRISSVIYPTPNLTGSANAYMIENYGGQGFEMCCFEIDGGQLAFTSNIPFVNIQTVQYAHIHDLSIYNVGNTNGGTSDPTLELNIFSGVVRNVTVQGSPATANDVAVLVTAAGLTLIENSIFSNHYNNLLVNASGGRGPTNSQLSIVGGLIDECGATSITVGCTQVNSGSVVNVSGATMWGSNSPSLSIDGTSSVYCTGCYNGDFNSGANQYGIVLSSGGKFFAASSHIAGNGTSSAFNGPAGASYIDEGGNAIQNCTNTTCALVTPAQYGTLGFTGGIIPKSSLTHTPSTCYAVTGALLATAQNLCTLLLDQNYQLLNVTAGQGGTPVTTSCTGAPVVTLSDGTRSATLTLTTANTTWSSSGLSTIFAAGTTLTVSIAANTCVTPPLNLFVNYVLQSALNN